MTTAATMPMPPMVGVPALAMWTWGPSSRICWPMLFLISQRMRTGVDSTATHRATPPDVISEITLGVPPRSGPRAARRAPRTRGRRTARIRPPPIWVRLVALAGHHHHVAGLGPARWPGGWPRPGRARPPRSAPAPTPDRISLDDGRGVLGPRDCPRSARRRRPAVTPPRPSPAASPGHGRPRSRTAQITRPAPARPRAAASATSRPAGVWA